MKLKMVAFVLILLAGLLWATTALRLRSGQAWAQTPTAEQVYAIARKLNCPLCQGVTLSDCPLPVCDQMRAIIKEKLAKGESEEQIVQFFVDQYGEQVLNAPPAQGFNLLVYVLPFLALAVGAVWVGFALRGWAARRRAVREAEVVEAVEELPEEYRRRLEEELEQL
jgi:cytochrome c-type biogenesis protein CcmH